jgi:hypothetical protein
MHFYRALLNLVEVQQYIMMHAADAYMYIVCCIHYMVHSEVGLVILVCKT